MNEDEQEKVAPEIVEGDEQHDEHEEWTHVRCPRCGEIVAQTPNGNYRKHESVAGKVCAATGQPVNP